MGFYHACKTFFFYVETEFWSVIYIYLGIFAVDIRSSNVENEAYQILQFCEKSNSNCQGFHCYVSSS